MSKSSRELKPLKRKLSPGPLLFLSPAPGPTPGPTGSCGVQSPGLETVPLSLSIPSRAAAQTPLPYGSGWQGGSASFPGTDLSAAQCRQSSPSALCCSPLAPQGLFPQWGDHPRRGCCHGLLHGEVGRAPFICGGQNTSPMHPLLLPTATRCFGVSVLVSQPCCTQGPPRIPDSMGEARGCVQMLLCA